MRNISDTEAYTLFDHVFSKTVRSLSAVVGLRRITQPFWNRWLASGIESEVIFEFLDAVGTIDNWPARPRSWHASPNWDARRKSRGCGGCPTFSTWRNGVACR
jgi:hypothetical protein